MQFNLFINESSNETINKTLISGTSYSVNIEANFDLLNPEIVIKDVQQDILNYNYCEFAELGRKYFIERVENIGSDFYKLFLSCDVLETFKAEILSCNARLTRNIRQGDYLDVALDSEVNPVVTTFESDSGFDGEKTLILSTVGE